MTEFETEVRLEDSLQFLSDNYKHLDRIKSSQPNQLAHQVFDHLVNIVNKFDDDEDYIHPEDAKPLVKAINLTMQKDSFINAAAHELLSYELDVDGRVVVPRDENGNIESYYYGAVRLCELAEMALNGLEEADREDLVTAGFVFGSVPHREVDRAIFIESKRAHYLSHLAGINNSLIQIHVAAAYHLIETAADTDTLDHAQALVDLATPYWERACWLDSSIETRLADTFNDYDLRPYVITESNFIIRRRNTRLDNKTNILTGISTTQLIDDNVNRKARLDALAAALPNHEIESNRIDHSIDIYMTRQLTDLTDHLDELATSSLELGQISSRVEQIKQLLEGGFRNFTGASSMTIFQSAINIVEIWNYDRTILMGTSEYDGDEFANLTTEKIQLLQTSLELNAMKMHAALQLVAEVEKHARSLTRRNIIDVDQCIDLALHGFYTSAASIAAILRTMHIFSTRMKVLDKRNRHVKALKHSKLRRFQKEYSSYRNVLNGVEAMVSDEVAAEATAFLKTALSNQVLRTEYRNLALQEAKLSTLMKRHKSVEMTLLVAHAAITANDTAQEVISRITPRNDNLGKILEETAASYYSSVASLHQNGSKGN